MDNYTRSRDGRIIKGKAAVTRDNFLVALAGAIETEKSWVSITPAMLSRKTEMSVGAFYQYWGGIEECFWNLWFVKRKAMMESYPHDLSVGPTRRMEAVSTLLNVWMEPVGEQCDHVFEYWWDEEDRVTRGTCQKCGRGKVNSPDEY